jgi:hypothetical protein
MAFLRETPNGISEGFVRLLPVALQILGVARMLICALEVVGKDLPEVIPNIDDVSR